ncbi:LysR family transcriptional regulator [Klebsiella michiganensis]|uniref:LysR family transcriptional regulator n=1 Tax=Klebsiella michiganensis TaxID=1134687 RepID=A0A7H4M3M5_9ENTR|nr:LysR family transcriptional regulator [Klebsiella michiganensis]STW66537.1 LysR family transcriptional regulator [Klebsiella michiganensis]
MDRLSAMALLVKVAELGSMSAAARALLRIAAAV